MNKTYLVVYTLRSRPNPNTFVDQYQTFRAEDYPDSLKEAKKVYNETLDALVHPEYPEYEIYCISLTEVIQSSDY